MEFVEKYLNEEKIDIVKTLISIYEEIDKKTINGIKVQLIATEKNTINPNNFIWETLLVQNTKTVDLQIPAAHDLSARVPFNKGFPRFFGLRILNNQKINFLKSKGIGFDYKRNLTKRITIPINAESEGKPIPSLILFTEKNPDYWMATFI